MEKAKFDMELPANLNYLNLQLAQTLFYQIHDYGYMHAGNTLVSSIIKAVDINLPGMGDYINSRMKIVEN